MRIFDLAMSGVGTFSAKWLAGNDTMQIDTFLAALSFAPNVPTPSAKSNIRILIGDDYIRCANKMMEGCGCV